MKLLGTGSQVLLHSVQRTCYTLIPGKGQGVKINCQLDIKLGQITEEELNALLKSRKAVHLGKISPEVWKTRKSDDILRFCNAVYKQNKKMNERLHLTLPQERQLGIATEA